MALKSSFLRHPRAPDTSLALYIKRQDPAHAPGAPVVIMVLQTPPSWPPRLTAAGIAAVELHPQPGKVHDTVRVEDWDRFYGSVAIEAE